MAALRCQIGSAQGYIKENMAMAAHSKSSPRVSAVTVTPVSAVWDSTVKEPAMATTVGLPTAARVEAPGAPGSPSNVTS